MQLRRMAMTIWGERGRCDTADILHNNSEALFRGTGPCTGEPSINPRNPIRPGSLSLKSRKGWHFPGGFRGYNNPRDDLPSRLSWCTAGRPVRCRRSCRCLSCCWCYRTVRARWQSRSNPAERSFRRIHLRSSRDLTHRNHSRFLSSLRNLRKDESGHQWHHRLLTSVEKFALAKQQRKSPGKDAEDYSLPKTKNANNLRIYLRTARQTRRTQHRPVTSHLGSLPLRLH